MLKNRTAGVLMPVSSMPSPYGIGVFDENIRHFINLISDMGFGYWQILPIVPVDSVGSPYCSCSAFAGNYMFINPGELVSKGFVSNEEAAKNIYNGSSFTADYDFVSKKRLELLEVAFLNTDESEKNKIKTFSTQNPWLKPFSLYMAIKEKNDMKPWWQWDEYSNYSNAENCTDSEILSRVEFWNFVQYEFYEQWNDLKMYAHNRNVHIIGDIPIYPALDSADVWANTDIFLIDSKTLRPEAVAGVPPDYFCADGQLWGNPVYDWEKMESDGYKWWTYRLEYALKIYDVVRIDHFRGFASFWKIPYGSQSAVNGEWVKGPGMKFFKPFLESHPESAVIAEDLGVFGKDVTELLKNTGFPGMKVVQFGFDPNDDSSNMPHHATENSVIYVGTHDNNTLLGWLWEISPEERAFVMDYCGFNGDNWGEGGYNSPLCRKIIETVWQTSANTAIITVQDMCGFGADTRLNTPGVAGGSWRWRITRDFLDGIDKNYFKHINKLYRRTAEFR